MNLKKQRIIGAVLAVITAILINYFIPRIPSLNSMAYWPKFIISIVIAGIIGWIYYKIVIRFF